MLGLEPKTRYEEELNIVNILDFKRNLTIYSDSVDSAEHFGRIKSDLKSKGAIIDGLE